MNHARPQGQAPFQQSNEDGRVTSKAVPGRDMRFLRKVYGVSDARSPLALEEAMELSDLDLANLFTEPEANRTVREGVLARLRANKGTGSVSVTNLVLPRQAFYRVKFPDVEIPLERRESMLAGTGFHDHFIRRVAREATMEQTLEWEGIVGRVDIYEKLPLEIKTTDSPVDPEDVERVRPSYLEQLGIYCGMAKQERGYLLIFSRSGEDFLAGFSADFGYISGIRREILRRRDAFRSAIKSGDPSGLPNCPFAGKTCVYFEKGICDCDPKVPSEFPVAGLSKVKPNPDLAHEFATRYAQAKKSGPPNEVTVLDLIHPREAYFRGLSEEEDGEDDVAESLRAADSYALYKEFKRACFRGSDFRGETISRNGVTGRVEFHDGRVLVFTKCSFVEPVKRYFLTRTFPEQFLKMGFNCVLANRGRGRLVVWYPKITAEDERILAYDITLRDSRPLAKEMDERLAALEEARATGDFSHLPKCQPWRAKFCTYNDRCGCETPD